MLLCHLELLTASYLVVVFSKVKGRNGLFLRFSTIIGSQNLAKEQGCGHTIKDNMVDIHKQIDSAWSLDNLYTIQVIVEQVKRTDKLLGVCCIWLVGQNDILNDCLGLIASLLLCFTINHSKTSLHIGVCIDDATYCSRKATGIFICKFVRAWDIVLQSLSVHLPVNINTLLVLRQWIIVFEFCCLQGNTAVGFLVDKMC